MTTSAATAAEKVREACGVFGVFSPEKRDMVSLVYYGLLSLQHRGQESAGIVTAVDGDLKTHKGLGLVSTVFDQDVISDFPEATIAVGHTRYSTTGVTAEINAQPFTSLCKLGKIALAHNGNLTNIDTIRELLEESGAIFLTDTDTEILFNLIARKADKNLEDSIINALRMVKGSYALIVMTEEKLIGVRDPRGVRPLCIGILSDGSRVLASESCALDAVGATLERDVEPGEMVIITKEGVESRLFSLKHARAVCSFEYIYFARPDSVIDKIEVYETRYTAGRYLYEQHPTEADVVVGVPDSGTLSAVGYSEASGIPNKIGLVKNKYIGRSFIQPSEEMRRHAVSVKFNCIKSLVKGQRVIIIDDSLVRGTTSRFLTQLLRNAGAKEVHFRIASPIVLHPCHFGIDMPTHEELISFERSKEEIGALIGADTIEYLSFENLEKVLRKKVYCYGCFNGEYPVETF